MHGLDDGWNFWNDRSKGYQGSLCLFRFLPHSRFCSEFCGMSLLMRTCHNGHRATTVLSTRAMVKRCVAYFILFITPFVYYLVRCNGDTVFYFYLTFNLFKSSLSSCRFNTYHPYVLFTYTQVSPILFFYYSWTLLRYF